MAIRLPDMGHHNFCGVTVHWVGEVRGCYE